ncbi:MAG: hypothetical protein WCF33_07630 [Pseudonocardiaceae bacterium]
MPVSDYDLESRFSKLEFEVSRLRETQLEQDQQINELRQDVDGLYREIGELRQEMRACFGMQATGMAQITALLTTIAGPERNGS